jgi:hypothetical protein
METGNKNSMGPKQINWDALRSFILTWCYPEINLVSDQDQLTSKRFKADSDWEFVALMCDESHSCLYNVTPAYYEYYLINHRRFRFTMRLHLMSLRESHMIKTYFHIKGEQYPALTYVRLKNDKLKVYTEPL